MTTREEVLYYWLGELPSPNDTIPVAWPGKNYRPVDGTSYLEPRYLPNRSDYGEVGTRLERHRGLFQVSVYGPRDNGIADAAVADAIIAHFKGQYISYGGLRVRIGSFDGSPGLPSRAPSFIDGSWSVTPVTIPWWSDQY